MSIATDPADRITASPDATPKVTPTITTELRFLKGAVPAAGGRVPALLRVRADAPLETRRRTAIDLALVLDRSGSMGGEPIHAAKTAAHDAIDLMEDGDRIALVAFDDEVDVVFPARDVTDRAPLHRAVESLDSRGRTALHAGWVEGTQQLVDLLADDRAARVLLLTDGRANLGVTDSSAIAADVARLKGLGVATSTVGLGRGFQEDLLATVAEAGGGRFAYAETPGQLEGLIAAELIAADATVGRDVRARLEVAGDRATQVEAVGAYRERDGALVLPDLLLGMPLEVPLEVPLRPGEPASDATLGRVTLAWTDADGETVRATVPIVADALTDDAYADRDDDPDVVVAHALATAGRQYGEAVDALDRRDRTRVHALLRELEGTLDGAPDDPRLTRQRARLEQAWNAVRSQDDGLARKRMHASREATGRAFEAGVMSASPFGQRKQQALRRRKAERDPAWGGHAPETGSTPNGRGPATLWRESARARGTTANAQLVVTADVPRPDGTTATLRVLQGDITSVPADALINPTNTHLHGSGRSVDGAVHRVGGRELTRECRAIGRIQLADTAVTKGHRLPVGYVIHVATPTYRGAPQDLALLEKAYAAAFDMARQMRIRHVTVPAIGTGANGFPAGPATERAVRALVFEAQVEGPLDRIDVVLLDPEIGQLYARALRKADLAPRAPRAPR